jgi:hypothetical protein
LEYLVSSGAKAKTNIGVRLAAWLRSFVDWRPATVPLPRSRCHYLELEMRGVPARLLQGAIRLQLAQLSGLRQIGFVYRPGKDRIPVWYWDEAKLPEEISVEHLSGHGKTGLALWPENVLSTMPGHGLHLIRRARGFEALAADAGEIRRTRWYPAMPDVEKWAAFARDAGYPVDGIAIPALEQAVLARTPPKNWRLVSRFLAPLPLTTWGMALLAALAGAGLLAASSYQIKLNWAIAKERAVVDKIVRENAAAIDLQRKISERMAYLEEFRRVQPDILQLEVLQALAEAGFADQEGKTALLEWEYRNPQLRLLFSVPPGVALGDFLARLETLPMLEDIRLQPDTAPQRVGIQAKLIPWRMPEPAMEPTSPDTAAEKAPEMASPPPDTAPQTPSAQMLPAVPSAVPASRASLPREKGEKP